MARTKRPTSRIPRKRAAGGYHNALFQLAFSQPRHAESELKNLLSSEIVSRIKWDKLRKLPDTFVDAKLTQRFTDILFEVEIDDQNTLIYVLFEHKSKPDRWTLLQLLEYEVRIWRDYLRKNPGVRHLPVILPVVVHHGSSGWTVPREFIEYFRHVPEDLRRHIPNFSIVLDDVGKISPDKLLGRALTPEAKLVLLCLLLGRKPERFLQELREHPAVLQETWNSTESAVVITAIIVYMRDVGRVPEEETVKVMQDILKFTPEERILFADKYLEHLAARAERRGERRGRTEGKLEGKLEGKVETLSRLLEQRFGSLSTTTLERLQEASAADLDAMTLRVLGAATVDDVLGKPKRQKK